MKLFKLLTLLGFVESNSEARRSIQQGAVKLNGVKLEDPNGVFEPKDGDIVQVGRRKFAKLIVS
ncbi:tyrosyl-tRNA synthetase [compost metagenome]